MPMLYIFGGLPGVGKSTLAQRLASRAEATYLRIDTIEHALSQAGASIRGPEGYLVAYALASDNLRLGQHVVADSVNPWELTRAAWREVASNGGFPFVEIEIICSDPDQHRQRVETRPAEMEGFKLPTWNDVIRRDYHPWLSEHITLNTARQTVDESMADLLAALAIRGVRL